MLAGGRTGRPWVWPVFAVIALGAILTAWTAVDRRPPEWDYANHLTRALGCHHILAEPGHDRFREIAALSSFYPPLPVCLAGLLYFAVPPTLLTARLLMLAWVALAMAAVYLTGRQLLDASAGALAAILLATAPFGVVLLTSFQVDQPLMALVALALWALARSDGFGSTGGAVVVGAVLGLGMLTKPTFAVYVAPPLCWTAWQAARAPGRRERLLRLGGALAVAAAVALPWYGPRLVTLPEALLYRATASGVEEGDAPALSRAGLLTYPLHLAYVLGPLTAALLLWGLAAVARRRSARGLLWTAAVLPFAIISLPQNKDLRYLLPLLPAMALLAAAAALGAPPAARRFLVAACMVAGALQLSTAAFGVPPPLPVPGPAGQLVASRPPDPAVWPQAAILDAIERERRGQPTTLAVIPNHPFFSRSNFGYEIARRGAPYQAARPWRTVPFGMDFVVVKSGGQGPAWTSERAERITRAFAGGDPHLAAVYPQIGEYPVPDGSVASLRVRRIPPLRGVSPAAVARRLEGLPDRLAEDPFIGAHVRDAARVRVTVEYAPEAILRGEVARLGVEVGSAVVGELARRDRAPLRVRDAAFQVEGLVINPHRLMATGALEVLDAVAVRVGRLRITEPDLTALLEGQPAGRGVRVELGDGEARVRLSRLGPPVSVRARLVPGVEDRPFALVVDELRVAGLPVPTALVNWVIRQLDPTRALRRIPVSVSIAPIHVRPGQIVVGEEPRP